MLLRIAKRGGKWLGWSRRTSSLLGCSAVVDGGPVAHGWGWLGFLFYCQSNFPVGFRRSSILDFDLLCEQALDAIRKARRKEAREREARERRLAERGGKLF